MKIFIATASFSQQRNPALDLLKKEKIKFFFNPYKRKLSENETKELIKDCDGIIAGTETYSNKVLEKNKSLKIISRVGTGIDSINLTLLKKKNIKLTNTPKAPVEAVSELTIGLIISLLRNIHNSNLKLHKNEWYRPNGIAISEAKIGILGFGRIGKRVAKSIKKLGGKNILIHDINNEINMENNNFKFVNLNSLIKNSDLITIHIPLTNKTRGMFNANILKKMKTGSYIVNTSRGEIIVEKDLVKFLKNGKIAGAALDVFSKEPYEGALTKIDNCLTTSHLGPMARSARLNMELEAVQEIIRFFRGQQLKNSIID